MSLAGYSTENNNYLVGFSIMDSTGVDFGVFRAFMSAPKELAPTQEIVMQWESEIAKKYPHANLIVRVFTFQRIY